MNDDELNRDVSLPNLFLQQFFALKICRDRTSKVCVGMRKFIVGNYVGEYNNLSNLGTARSFLKRSGHWSDIWDGCGDLPVYGNDVLAMWMANMEVMAMDKIKFFDNAQKKMKNSWDKSDDFKYLNSTVVQHIVTKYPAYLKQICEFDFYRRAQPEIRPVTWCINLLKSFSEHGGIMSRLGTKVIAETISNLKVEFITAVDGEKIDAEDRKNFTKEIAEWTKCGERQTADGLSRLNPSYRLHFFARFAQLIRTLERAVEGAVEINSSKLTNKIIAKAEEISQLRQLHEELVRQFCQDEYQQLVHFGPDTDALLTIQHLAATESFAHSTSAKLPIALISIVGGYGHLDPGTADDYKIIQKRLAKMVDP